MMDPVLFDLPPPLVIPRIKISNSPISTAEWVNPFEEAQEHIVCRSSPGLKGEIFPSEARSSLVFGRDPAEKPKVIPTPIQIKWSNIVARFENEFAKTFSKSKKAHFDCLPKELKVVDGARVRWFPLLLVDAMIFILHNNHFRFATRRAFNQLEILYDCILAEVECAYPEFHEKLRKLQYQDTLSWPMESSPEIYEDMSIEEQQSLISQEEEANLLISFACAEKFPGIQVEDILYPWGSLADLKGRLSEDPPSKSKQKFLMIIDYLSRHHSFTHPDYSFADMMKATICKVLAYFGSNRSLLSPSVHLQTLCKSKAREEGVVSVITPMHRSPPNHTPMTKLEDSPFSYGDNEVCKRSRSLSYDELKLPPTAMTLIARHQIKRKKSSLKRDIKVKKFSPSSINRNEIVYSNYPDDASRGSAASTSRLNTSTDCISLSFVNPFLFEEQELSISQQASEEAKRSALLETSYRVNDSVGLSFTTAVSDSITSSNAASSESWDTDCGTMLNTSGESFYNISSDSMNNDVDNRCVLNKEPIVDRTTPPRGDSSIFNVGPSCEMKESGCDETRSDSLYDPTPATVPQWSASYPQFPRTNKGTSRFIEVRRAENFCQSEASNNFMDAAPRCTNWCCCQLENYAAQGIPCATVSPYTLPSPSNRQQFYYPLPPATYNPTRTEQFAPMNGYVESNCMNPFVTSPSSFDGRFYSLKPPAMTQGYNSSTDFRANSNTTHRNYGNHNNDPVTTLDPSQLQ